MKSTHESQTENWSACCPSPCSLLKSTLLSCHSWGKWMFTEAGNPAACIHSSLSRCSPPSGNCHFLQHVLGGVCVLITHRTPDLVHYHSCFRGINWPFCSLLTHLFFPCSCPLPEPPQIKIKAKPTTKKTTPPPSIFTVFTYCLLSLATFMD